MPAPAWLGSAITGVAGVVGGLLGAKGQRDANRANLQIAREQMRFQERMSNTAVTRRMQDLQLAGINPILAGRYDATTPPGALATMGNVEGAGVSAAGAMAGTAMQARQLHQQLKNMETERQRVEQVTRTEGQRYLLIKHGQEVASIAADIARTVRKTLGDPTPGAAAKFIEQQLDKFRGALTNALERGSGSAQAAKSTWEELKSDISIYINDELDKPLFNVKPSRAERKRYDAYKASGGKLSFELWRDRNQGIRTVK